MQKKFVSNLLLMVLLNLLIKPVAIFGVDAAVQNRVGVEEYGIYFALLNFSFLFNIFLDLGVNNYTTKSVAQYPKMAAKYLGQMLIFRLLLFLLYVLITFGLAMFLDYNGREFYLLGILSVNQLFVMLIAYIRGHLGGFLLFKSEAFIGVLDRLLLIIFCFYSLYISADSEVTIEWFIWMQFVCYAITLFIALIILFKKIGKPIINLKSKASLVIVRKSFPYALLILLMMVYTRTDSVMLEQIHVNGERESGIYAQGFRLINALFLFAMLFSNLLYPMFSKMLSKNENVIPLLNLSSKLLIGGAIGLSILTYYNSTYILKLIYSHNVVSSAEPFKMLMISFVGMCISIVYGTLLTAAGNLKLLNIISGIGILINISLNYFLIPEHGAYGAAIATVVTQMLVALVQMIYVIMHYEIKLINKHLILFTGYICSLFLIFNSLQINSLGIFLLSLFIIPILMIVFRQIDIIRLKSIIASEE